MKMLLLVGAFAHWRRCGRMKKYAFTSVNLPIFSFSAPSQRTKSLDQKQHLHIVTTLALQTSHGHYSYTWSISYYAFHSLACVACFS